MSLRLRVACRPILGLLIRGQPVPIPEPVAILVRHQRLGLWLRNPWPEQSDPRRDWGDIRQAYRFHSLRYAHDTINEQQIPATAVEIPLTQLTRGR